MTQSGSKTSLHPNQVHYNEFLDWFQLHCSDLEQKAGNSCKLNRRVTLHPFVATGRGCSAISDICAGDTILDVPESIILCQKSAVRYSSFGHLVEKLNLNSSLTLLLLLMHESARKDSRWKPYFDVLPRSVPLPLFWDRTDVAKLKGLQGNVVKSTVSYYRKHLLEYYRGTVQPIVRGNSSVFSVKKMSFKRFCWANSIVWSRGFQKSKDEVIVVPFADMFNMCAEDGGARDVSEFEFIRKSYGTFFRLRSLAAYEKGSQVYVEYGSDKSNAQLLLYYGFIFKDNVADRLELPVQELSNENLTQMQRVTLSKLGLMQPHFCMKRGRIPKKLFVSLRVRFLSEESLHEILQNRELATIREKLTLPSTADIELKVFEVIIQLLTGRLEVWSKAEVKAEDLEVENAFQRSALLMEERSNSKEKEGSNVLALPPCIATPSLCISFLHSEERKFLLQVQNTFAALAKSLEQQQIDSVLRKKPE